MIPFNAGIATSTGLFGGSASAGGQQGVGGLSGFFAALLAQGQFGAADTTLLERSAEGVSQQFSGKGGTGIDVPVTHLNNDETDFINAIANSLDSVSEDDIKQILSLISQTYSVGVGGGGGDGSVDSIATGGAFAQNTDTAIAPNASNTATVDASLVSFEVTIIEFRSEIIQFKEAGISTENLGNLSSLAKAYTKMGMDPAEAQVKAERVEKALAAMKEHLLAAVDGLDVADFSTISAAMGSFITQATKTATTTTTYTKETVSITHITRAFEGSSALGSVDIASQALKGEPLTPEAKIQPGTQMLSASSEMQSAKIAEPFVQQSVTTADINTTDNFEELSLKQVNVDSKILEQSSGTARENVARNTIENVPSADSTLDNNVEGVLAKAANVARESSASVDRFDGEYTVSEAGKRIVSEIRHGLLNDAPQGETIMKITASENGAGLDTLETATGEEIHLDNIDQAVDEAMDAFQGKSTSEGRVDARHVNGAARHFSQNALITQQASLQMKSLANQGGGMAKFMLNPPELGQLEVHLEVTSVNAVKATIIVQTQEVAEQLARDLQQLEQSLADSGLDMDKEGFTFKLQDDAESKDDQQLADEGSSDGLEGTSDDESTANASETTENARWVKPDSLIDEIV